MGTTRITESTMFAYEMARAALPQILSPSGLSGIWKHMDGHTNHNQSPSIMLRLRVHGVASAVHIACNIHKQDDGQIQGDCTVTLDDHPGRSWSFRCRRTGNTLQTTLQKQYSQSDIEWLELRVREILQDDRFEEFKAASPHAARVLIEGGRTYGPSTDAAVAEFDTFISLT